MSAADAYTEYPITEPVRPVEVVTRLGKHGPWERIAAPLQHPYVRTAGRGVLAGLGATWSGLCWYGRNVEHAGAGWDRLTARPCAILTDADGAKHVSRLRGDVQTKEREARQLERDNKRTARRNKGVVPADDLVAEKNAWTAVKAASIELEEARDTHRSRLRWRLIPTSVVGGGLALYGLYELAQLPHIVPVVGFPALAFTAPLGLHRLGRPKVADVQQMRTRTRKRRTPVVSDQLIAQAWGQLTLSKHGPLELLDPVQELADHDGWIVPAMLPGTLLVDDLEKLHGQFAKALGNRRRENVQIIRDATQGEGFFYLQVLKKGAHERSIGTSPLGSLGLTSYTEPIVFAEDTLHNPRAINAANTHVFIGGQTQMGKSKTIEQIVTRLMLDPTAVLHDIDLSGRPNYRSLFELSSFTICGIDLDQTYAYLVWLDSERERRAALMRQGHELPPLFVILDEIHELLMSKEYKTKAAPLLERIARNCFGMNIHLIIATQQPDSNSIPAGVMGQCGVRIGLHVKKSWVSDLMIENGQQRGIDCAKLPSVPGMAIVDDAEGPTQVRVYPPDPAVIEAKVAEALAARGGVVEKLNLKKEVEDLKVEAQPFNSLNGEGPQLALDETQKTSAAFDFIPEEDLLRDILFVSPATPEQIAYCPAREHGVRYDELAELLKRTDNPEYSRLTEDELRSRLASVGVQKDEIFRRGGVKNKLTTCIKFAHVRCVLGDEQCTEKVCTHRKDQK